jgi:hypothetical protein
MLTGALSSPCAEALGQDVNFHERVAALCREHGTAGCGDDGSTGHTFEVPICISQQVGA